MSPLLALVLSAAHGCPAALATAAATPDGALGARAPALVAELEDATAGPAAAVAAAARALGGGDSGPKAAAAFRRALARHCALAAAPREPEASAADRAALADVLARPELSQVRLDPSAIRRAISRVWDWLVELLGTAQAERYASLGRALFLGAAAAAVVLALTGIRRRRRAARDAREPAPTGAERAGAGPDATAARADEALRRGDAREAVRLALLAALGALERAGRVPRGRALTNEEVLNLLTNADDRSSTPTPTPTSTPTSTSTSTSTSTPTSTPTSTSTLSASAPDLALLILTFDRAIYGGLAVALDDARAALERSRRIVQTAGGS